MAEGDMRRPGENRAPAKVIPFPRRTKVTRWRARPPGEAGAPNTVAIDVRARESRAEQTCNWRGRALHAAGMLLPLVLMFLVLLVTGFRF